MYKFQPFSRVLAAAVSSVFVVAAAPASADVQIVITGAPVTACGPASVNSTNGNITFNCSTGSTPPPAPPPSPPPAPPPPGGNISCSNIPGITATKVIPISWQYVSGIASTAKSIGGFGANDAVVYVMTVPAGASSGGRLGDFSMSPTDQYAYNDRMISISDAPCDFSRKLGRASVKIGQEPNVYFSVGGYPLTRYGTQDTNNANLNPGQTYYVTVIQKSTVDGGSTCMAGTCNINYALHPGS
jgi:hypothetical protein